MAKTAAMSTLVLPEAYGDVHDKTQSYPSADRCISCIVLQDVPKLLIVDLGLVFNVDRFTSISFSIPLSLSDSALIPSLRDSPSTYAHTAP
jgi:hypothetical protein